MSRTPHKPLPESRKLVQLHVVVGTTEETIALILGIDAKTLRKYYAKEIALSKAKANAAMGGSLYNKGMGGDTAAIIFWMKTQAGWREKSDINHTSDDGSMTPRVVERIIIDVKHDG